MYIFILNDCKKGQERMNSHHHLSGSTSSGLTSVPRAFVDHPI